MDISIIVIIIVIHCSLLLRFQTLHVIGNFLLLSLKNNFILIQKDTKNKSEHKISIIASKIIIIIIIIIILIDTFIKCVCVE